LINTWVPHVTYVFEEEHEEKKIMHMNNIFRPSVGADVSALLGGCSYNPDYVVNIPNEIKEWSYSQMC
jgi:hypothetical protein